MYSGVCTATPDIVLLEFFESAAWQAVAGDDNVKPQLCA